MCLFVCLFVVVFHIKSGIVGWLRVSPPAHTDFKPQLGFNNGPAVGLITGPCKCVKYRGLAAGLIASPHRLQTTTWF